jgi:glycine/D-amino acid oxidase-like deaminating enzyme
MNTSFDVIVIGVGSMGSAACYYLTKNGYKVLGIEQFDISHEYGSHAGQSRIIRKAYFENPIMFRCWKEHTKTGRYLKKKQAVRSITRPD